LRNRRIPKKKNCARNTARIGLGKWRVGRRTISCWNWSVVLERSAVCLKTRPWAMASDQIGEKKSYNSNRGADDKKQGGLSIRIVTRWPVKKTRFMDVAFFGRQGKRHLLGAGGQQQQVANLDISHPVSSFLQHWIRSWPPSQVQAETIDCEKLLFFNNNDNSKTTGND